jgi:uncharacterized protein (TIGR04222 family)
MSGDRTGQTLDSPWTDETRARWRRIRVHAFEDADAPLDFVAKLAREQGWSRDQVRAAIEEYRRFCFLSSVCDETMVPSVAVDEVWHLHLTYTEDYWQRFCPDALGVALHHRPGGLGRDDAAHYRQRYAETLAEYERWFGTPPERWWPGTVERFRRPGRFRRVDRDRVWLIRKPRWSIEPGTIALGAIGLVAASFVEAMPLNPLDWTGPAFLVLFLALMVASTLFAAAWRRAAVETGRGDQVHELDPSAMAMLAGGEARVVERAVGELLTRGVARFDASSRRLAVTEVPHDLDDSARDIAEALRCDGDVGTVLTRCRTVLDRLRGQLVQRGLWLDAQTASRIALRSTLAPGLVLALGIAKIAVGLSRDRPVALLVVLCLLLAAVTLGFALKRPSRSRSGDRVLAELTRRHARAMRAPRAGEWPIALALVGSSVLAGTAYAAFHEDRHPQGSGGSDGGSSSSSDSSDAGSDSGGGDSGGGCGGCGGGD